MVRKYYYEQLYANKSDNLDKMGKFLETQNLVRPNHKESEILNRPLIFLKDWNSKQKNFQQQKKPG